MFFCRNRPNATAWRSLIIRLLMSTAIVGLNAVFALSASAQVLMQPNLSAAQARTIVDTIIAECSLPGGLITVTVAIVDRAGLPVMQLTK